MAAESPYATAIAFERTKASHIPNEEDKDRVTAYWTYSDIYHNVASVFEPKLRSDEGEEISRRLIPVARTIIEATNRYLAKDPTITPEPLAVGPDGTEVEPDEAAAVELMALWGKFAAREEFFTQFVCMKRWMLIRGDALFHVTGDDKKPQGERISIEEIDPSTYFKIYNPINQNRIDGVYIVTLVANDNNDGVVAQRQEYRKTPTGAIFTRVRFFAEDKWDDRWPLKEEDLEEVEIPERFDIPEMQNLLTGFELDPKIRQIPVYHYRNRRQGGLQYGISEIQGIETMLAGVSQTATDEDLTMALTGIGVYVTDSGRPKDDNQQDVEWTISPAAIIELDAVGGKFERIKGVDSVEPMLDHMNMLEAQAQKTTGTPDVAAGTVEVSVAESGIALAIRMAPVLSKNQETEMELKLRTEQLLHDLVNGWFPAYEAYTPTGIELSLTFGDPLPTDRAAVLNEVLEMVREKVVSIEFAQEIIRAKLGYDIPAGDIEKIAGESAALDPVGARLGEEAVPAAGEPGEVA